MKDYFGQICAWYLNRRSQKKASNKKKIDDEKLKEVVTRLKQLQEFIVFLNEKAFANRHERKAFWRDVRDERPVVEDTLKRILSRYGVKDETLEELEKRKNEKIEATKVEEKSRQHQQVEAKKAKELSFIKNGICINNGESICNLGYACDGCPYNRTSVATKKQIIDATEKKDEDKI